MSEPTPLDPVRGPTEFFRSDDVDQAIEQGGCIIVDFGAFGARITIDDPTRVVRYEYFRRSREDAPSWWFDDRE